jgi:RNA polymerase sigma-70 factor, ECF subfamily
MGLYLHKASGIPTAEALNSKLAVVDAAPVVPRADGMPTGDDLAHALPDLLPRLWRFAVRLTGDPHAAEDLVQRGCVRALERRHQLKPGTSARSWMYSILHSVWLNEIRARQIRQHASMQWSDELAETIPDESGSDPERDLMHRQIIQAVERLPDAQRAVMLLVAVEGLSYREAAEALEIPVGTVMSRLARARLTIGQAFAPARP